MDILFLDTNVLSYAAGRKVHQKAEIVPSRLKKKDGKEQDITVIWHSNIPRPPRDVDKLSEEITILKRIAHEAELGQAELCYSHEVNLELLFQPMIDVYPRFFGAPYRIVDSPADYRCGIPQLEDEPVEHPIILSGPRRLRMYYEGLQHDPSAWKEILTELLFRLPVIAPILFFEFRLLVVDVVARRMKGLSAGDLLRPHLQQITDERYKAILRSLAGERIVGKKAANLYIDAFLLWTAEEANCTHFLTYDKDILSGYKSARLKAIQPAEYVVAVRPGERG
jgi:predicted nucleic acid-binding protein